MKLVEEFIPPNKVDLIFRKLENFLKNEIYNYQKLFPYVNQFKNIIKTKEEDQIFKELELIGKECAKNNVLYIETINIIDFLKDNFIAQLSSSTPLKVGRRFERFFSKVETSFSKGYLLEQIKKDYKNFEDFKEYIKSKNLDSDFYYYFSTHIDYFLTCLKSLFNYDYCIVAIIDTCDFGEWLNERKKDLLKEELNTINAIEEIHDNFHRLLILIQNAYQKNKYKNVIFLIEELKNHTLWIGNKISILNNVIILKKLRKDPLTGLLTRHNLEVIIEKQRDIVKVTGGKIYLLFIDVDNFKKINDIYGHLVGDNVLKEVAKRIKSNIRKSDYAFRYGGEEFLVVLPFTEKEEALLIAERIRKTVAENPVKYQNYSIPVTVSIGVSEFNMKKTVKENLEIVDQKLYEAKRTGKNKVVI